MTQRENVDHKRRRSWSGDEGQPRHEERKIWNNNGCREREESIRRKQSIGMARRSDDVLKDDEDYKKSYSHKSHKYERLSSERSQRESSDNRKSELRNSDCRRQSHHRKSRSQRKDCNSRRRRSSSSSSSSSPPTKRFKKIKEQDSKQDSKEERYKSKHHHRRDSSHSTSSSSSARKHHRRRRKEATREKKKRKSGGDGNDRGVTYQWGKYGIIQECDKWTKKQEFQLWLIEIKKIGYEGLSPLEEKNLFKEYMEDYNTATLPHEKFYNVENWEKGQIDISGVAKSDVSTFDDEKRRLMEIKAIRDRRKIHELHAAYQDIKADIEKAEAMKEQKVLENRMKTLFKIGRVEEAQKIRERLRPDDER